MPLCFCRRATRRSLAFSAWPLPMYWRCAADVLALAVAVPIAGDGGTARLEIGDPLIQGGGTARVGRRFGLHAERCGGGDGPVHVAAPEQAPHGPQEAQARRFIAADLRGD